MSRTVTREEAIDRLRSALIERAAEDESLCRTAARQGIFCRGFNQFDEDELRRKYWWIVQKRPDITRVELEEVADRWQLSQQDVSSLACACDVQTAAHDTCRGWDDFTSPQLAAWVRQLTGEDLVVSA